MVLAGGLSPERDVSLRSGRRVRDALDEAGVDATIADADASLIPALLADPPDAVFPAIHGSYGEDGAIREILGLLNVPYVGSVASACRGAFDKPTEESRKFILGRCRVGTQLTMDLWYSAWLRSEKMPKPY